MTTISRKQLFKLVTWNLNGAGCPDTKHKIEHVVRLANDNNVDVLCFQETKWL